MCVGGDVGVVCFICSQQELWRSSHFCFETLFKKRLFNFILFVIHINNIPECPPLRIGT